VAVVEGEIDTVGVLLERGDVLVDL